MTLFFRQIFVLIFVIAFSNILHGQGNASQEFDREISNSIALSEKSLFDAKFDEALHLVDLSHFKTANLFRPIHEIQLLVQRQRIEGFKNLLFQVKTDREKRLNELLMLSSSTDADNYPEASAEFYLALSSTYRGVGEGDSSEVFEKRAYVIFEKIDDRKRLAEIRANQISRKHTGYFSEGDTVSILRLIPAYLEEISFSAKHRKYALAYNTRHLGQILRRQTGDLEKALSLFQQSLKLREEIGFKPFIPASHSSIGDVLLAMNDFDGAIVSYEKSIELANEIGFVRYLLYPNIQIGDIYKKRKQFDLAGRYYLNAFNHASRMNHSSGMEQASERLKAIK